MKDPKIFLQHILESIEILEGYVNGISEHDFINSIEKQDLAARRLEIIGEAVKNLPNSFRKKYPNIEWTEIAGARDVLIHAYFNVDPNLLWKIVKNDIPKLKNEVKIILKED